MKRFPLSSVGTSLVELSVAMLIGSIVLTTAYKTNDYISRSTDRENQKALIQRDIITVTEKLGREIRMAGLGLPGNGVKAELSDTSSDKLQVFSNDTKSKTQLAVNLSYSDTKIFVNSIVGAKSTGWVCIAGNGLDTIYCNITAIGENISGPDTVYLNGTVGAGVFTIAATDVYFCTRVLFEIEKTGSSSSLVVQKNGIAVNLGGKIDSLNIVLRNSSGTVIAAGFENAAMVTVFTGGYVGNGQNRFLVSESMDINIRNRS
jgi:hypothetical protein